jgi:hypothetical protein
MQQQADELVPHRNMKMMSEIPMGNPSQGCRQLECLQRHTIEADANSKLHL